MGVDLIAPTIGAGHYVPARSCALAMSRDASNEDTEAEVTAEHDVEAALAIYADAWRLNSAVALVDHWSPEQFAYYKAEEVRGFFTEWADVLAYWVQNEGLHDDIRLQLSNIKHIALAPDRRMVAMDMNWDIRFALEAKLADGRPFHHRGKAMGGFNRVLAMLTLSQKRWKLVGWSETPDAAITYLTDLYYRTAAADFGH
jgi:hypothetical protein